MNNIKHLIQLANRIGSFFEAMPDRAEALEGITNHIQKFWEPRMRTAMLEFLRENPSGRLDDATLHPMALEAIANNTERLTPKGRV